MNIATIIADRSTDAIISCNADTPLVEAIRILGKQRIGAMPVLREGRVSAVLERSEFSEHNVLKFAVGVEQE